MTARRRRRPRLRTQLTLLYAGPFLASGVLLLSFTFLSVSESVPANGSAVRIPPPDPGRHVAQQLLGASAIGLAGMVVISLLLGWLVAGRFLRPLRTITATARDISASNLHRRLGPTGHHDELTQLAATLDDLFGRLEAAFESQRRFVADASHELRTPLTAERALLQVALADPETTVDSLRATCREVLALGEAQERLIESLLTLASSEQGLDQREPVDLADLVDDVLSTRHGTARAHGIRLDAAPTAATTSGDPHLLESLIANLVDNAIRHNQPGGLVRVTTSTVDGRARLTVGNTGPLVPPDQLDRLFQPFQRLGRQRVGRTNGHGLGLAIVRAIATAHGATLTPHAPTRGGLEVTVTFR